MARKGHTNNPNGRPKGAKNKVTSSLKNWIQTLIDNNRDQFEKDLKELEPKDRLLILEKLMNYAAPKLQSISLEDQIRIEYEHLEKLLDSAPDEAINKIYERMANIEAMENEKE